MTAAESTSPVNQHGREFDILCEDFAWLQIKWSEYKALFGVSEAQVDVLNAAAGTFFYMLQIVLWDDIMLHLCRLTDPPQYRGYQRLTIKRLPEWCQEPSLLGTTEERVRVASDATEFARDWRNRKIAHTDLSLVVGDRAKPLEQATRERVGTAVSAINAALNFHSVNMYGHESADVPPLFGSSALLTVIEHGMRAQKCMK